MACPYVQLWRPHKVVTMRKELYLFWEEEKKEKEKIAMGLKIQVEGEIGFVGN